MHVSIPISKNVLSDHHIQNPKNCRLHRIAREGSLHEFHTHPHLHTQNPTPLCVEVEIAPPDHSLIGPDLITFAYNS